MNSDTFFMTVVVEVDTSCATVWNDLELGAKRWLASQVNLKQPFILITPKLVGILKPP